MPSDRDIALEVFQIKGRLAQGTATDADRAFLGRALTAEDSLVRLIAASVVIAQQAPWLQGESLAVVSSAISKDQIGGAFPQILFWEAMTCIPLDQINQESLLDIAEAHVDDPHTERINAAFALRRMSLMGSHRASKLLARYESS